MGAGATKIWIYGSHMCFTRQPSPNKATELLLWTLSLFLVQWDKGAVISGRLFLTSLLSPSLCPLYLIGPGLISVSQVSPLVLSSIARASRLLISLLTSTQFKVEQDFKQTNKINKQEPMLSLQCFQVHKSLITFSVNMEGGSQHMDCERKCVTWNLVLCKCKVPHGFQT